jgi:hypothetical protein
LPTAQQLLQQIAPQLLMVALCRVLSFEVGTAMGQTDSSNPVSEHSLYLTLFASSAGGL